MEVKNFLLNSWAIATSVVGCFLFVFPAQREGKEKERFEGIYGSISVRFKSLDVIRSRAVCCCSSPLYIAPAILQNKVRLQLRKALLPSFSELVNPPDSST